MTVVTIVRDRTAHLANLVRGLDQVAGEGVGLVVVQMGGPDPSPAWGATRRPVHHVRARRPGLPLADARNQGAEAAETDHLVFLDVDCIPGPGLVDAYDDALADHDAIFLGGVGYLPAGGLDEPWRVEDLRDRSRPHPARPHPGPGADRPADATQFWSLSFGVRRTTFLDRIDGFDDGYDGYGGEDTDFAQRAVAAGVPLRWLGGAVAHHQHHDTWSPPLPHLVDIVANARRFHRTWGWWPMGGWLEDFAAAGLVSWDPEGDRLEVRRLPTVAELEATRREGVVA